MDIQDKVYQLTHNRADGTIFTDNAIYTNKTTALDVANAINCDNSGKYPNQGVWVIRELSVRSY